MNDARAHYTISEADHVAFSRLHFDANLVRGLLITGGVCTIMVAGLALIDTSVALGGAIGSALVIVLIPLVHRQIVGPWRSRRAYRQFALLHEPVELTATSDGFSLAQPSGTVSLGWTSVFRWNENADVFAIYPAGTMAYILPKRAIDVSVLNFIRMRLIESGLTRKGETRV